MFGEGEHDAVWVTGANSFRGLRLGRLRLKRSQKVAVDEDALDSFGAKQSAKSFVYP